MSFRKFRRKLGLRSSRDDQTSQGQGHAQQDQRQPDLRAAGPACERTSSNFLADSPSPSISVTPSPADEPPQANAKDGATQETAPTRKGNDDHIRELWDLAYEALRDEDERLIQDFEKKIEGDLGAGLSKTVGSRIAKRDWMATILTRKMEKVNQDSWTLKFGSSEVLVKDVVKPVLGVVSWANDFISKATSANPSASLAWGGVSLLLPLFLNPSEQAAALAQGLEYISSLIVQSYLWEDLYERYSKSEAGGPSHVTFRSSLTMLYHHVLKFQITSYCYYARSTAYRLGLDSVKWHEWEELLEKIKEQDRVFSAVLNGCRDVRYDEECSAAEQRHEKAMSCWQAIGTDVSGLLSAVREAQRQNERKELLQWLCAVDTSVLYNAARDKHQTGTCSWLVEDSKDFKTWMESPKSLLWLNGKPGSGKSILSSSVIKHLQDKCNSDPGTALAYFYFNFGTLEQQSVTIMLSSLVKQLCASRPDTPPTIKNFENYMTKGERPDIQILEAALIASIHGFSDVFIIIDALDECPTLNGERGKLLASLTRIETAMPDNLHLFCTSRPEPDISIAINRLLCPPSRSAIDLLRDTTGLHSDISLYIDSVLESDDYHSWPEELKADAKRLLVERADGMFQYIVCQFEGLRNLRSRSLIRTALENLPKGLDATYDRLLLSIEPDFRAQVLSALKWLAFSKSTLELRKLAEIFILHPERAVGIDEAERLFEPEEVLRYISSLVTVQKDNRYDETYVRLAHFTVKEYLISGRIGKGPAACFSFTEDDAHLHISYCCLVYHLYTTDKIWVEGGFPLRKYAASHWGWHLELAPRQRWTSEIVRLAAIALAAHSKSLRKLLEYGTEANYATFWSRDEDFLRCPCCYTAASGFLNLTDLLLSPASDTYDYLTQEDLDLTLRAATLAGSTGIVRLVLDRGAHVDAQYDGRRSVLQIAVSQNDPEIVQLLLSRGADASLSGCPLTTALSWLLAQNPNRTSLQLLIDNGADVNKQCAIHGTALSMAASRILSHDTRYFVDFLLQHGADVNLSGGPFGHPLQAACSSGIFSFKFYAHSYGHEYHWGKHVDQDAVVMTLLEMGAEVNAQGGEYGNALQAASYVGTDAVVRLLLDRGAETNMSGGNFGTALQAACVTGRRNIVGILLASGADINAPGGEYGNALQAACANGHWEIVGMLLDQGAQVDAQGGKYGNALQAACNVRAMLDEHCSNMEVVQLLLERGADVNALGGRFGTALQAAILSTHDTDEEITSILLSKGADVNQQGGPYGTALQGACAVGKISVVRLLLAHGSNLNTIGGEYGTALQAACASEGSGEQRSELVSLLIEHGADVHLQGGVFGSAWHAAATKMDRKSPDTNDTLKMLLDHGVDVNDSRGRRHGTALQAALELSRDPNEIIPRLRFLLENGADINAGAGIYGFPLQSACMAPPYESFEVSVLYYLFDNCHDIDVSMIGGIFGTALQAAAYNGNLRAIRRLIGDLGYYELDYDPYNGTTYEAKVKLVNARGGEYGSALDAAAYAGEKETLEWLLMYGADADARGVKYGSALNAAVIRGYWNIVEILLKAGAVPDCHELLEPDGEWLKWLEKEDGRGAVERYWKFWEIQKLKME